MYNYFLHARTYFVLKRKQIWETVNLKKSSQYTPFVILCAPRSGSTLLHTYLNYHRNIHSFGEILRESQLGKPTNEDLVSTRVFKKYTTNLKAVGMKLFYEYSDEDSPYFPSFREVLNRRDVHVIHLTRYDILRLYVSLKLAEKTNVWSTGKPTAPDHSNKIVVDVTDFLAFKKVYLERQELFRKIFENHPTVSVSYEDLTTNTNEVLQRLQLFLKVPVYPLKSLLKKQNQGRIERYVLNCDELVAAGILAP